MVGHAHTQVTGLTQVPLKPSAQVQAKLDDMEGFRPAVVGVLLAAQVVYRLKVMNMRFCGIIRRCPVNGCHRYQQAVSECGDQTERCGPLSFLAGANRV